MAQVAGQVLGAGAGIRDDDVLLLPARGLGVHEPEQRIHPVRGGSGRPRRKISGPGPRPDRGPGTAVGRRRVRQARWRGPQPCGLHRPTAEAGDVEEAGRVIGDGQHGGSGDVEDLLVAAAQVADNSQFVADGRYVQRIEDECASGSLGQVGRQEIAPWTRAAASDQENVKLGRGKVGQQRGRGRPGGQGIPPGRFIRLRSVGLDTPAQSMEGQGNGRLVRRGKDSGPALFGRGTRSENDGDSFQGIF